MAKVFFSYSHDDEAFRDQLEKHLALLRRQGLIESWHDRRIPAGSTIDNAISEQLETADIVLLLVSASFIHSDYCYSREMTRALELHKQQKTIVVPVIVRPCDWHNAPFGQLLAVPRDGKPIELWANHDEAYTDVAKQIRVLVEKVTLKPVSAPVETKEVNASPVPARSHEFPRSSNLRLKKEFTQRDKESFLLEGFEYIVRFFDGSLKELCARNPGVESSLRRIDANTFTAAIYRNGAAASECVVRLGGLARDNGITFSWDASSAKGAFNEMLSVDVDDQAIYFRPLGMAYRQAEKCLSYEGAAEFLWELLIQRLQ